MAMLNIPSFVHDPSYRYKMPRIVGQKERSGNNSRTAIVNAGEVASSLKHDPKVLTKFIAIELVSSLTYTNKAGEGERAIIQGHHENTVLQALVDKFIEKYVLCRECGLPEIDVAVKQGFVVAKCRACSWRGDLDNQHKLATFIVRHPPPATKTVVDVRTPKPSSKKEQRHTSKDRERDDDEITSIGERKKSKKEKKHKKSVKDDDDDDDETGSYQSEIGEKTKKSKKEKKQKKCEKADDDDDDETGSYQSEIGEKTKRSKKDKKQKKCEKADDDDDDETGSYQSEIGEKTKKSKKEKKQKKCEKADDDDDDDETGSYQSEIGEKTKKSKKENKQKKCEKADDDDDDETRSYQSEISEKKKSTKGNKQKRCEKADDDDDDETGSYQSESAEKTRKSTAEKKKNTKKEKKNEPNETLKKKAGDDESVSWVSESDEGEDLTYDGEVISSVIEEVATMVKNDEDKLSREMLFEEVRLWQVTRGFDDKLRIFIVLSALFPSGTMDKKGILARSRHIRTFIDNGRMSFADWMWGFDAYIATFPMAAKVWPMTLKGLYDSDFADEEHFLAYFGEERCNPGFSMSKRSANPFIQWLEKVEESDSDTD